jgi:DEAD/DEAH box helicase domain-containing protein
MSRAEELLFAAAGIALERIAIPPRAERPLAIPAAYARGRIAKWISAMTSGAGQLWRHQSLALTEVAAGRNVVVSTGTASGKSLVFMAPIIDMLMGEDGKAIVFYPQKALGGDQLRRFQVALARAGLDPQLVGEINGDVDPSLRDEVLSNCRLVLATPDVVHAWMMPQVQSRLVREFLRQLKIIVLDEAHVFEGIFGSNVAYLLRRLRAAHAETLGSHEQLQWIAATATIRDPAEHLQQLTGVPFTVIGEEDNGSPFHGLTLFHISGPDKGSKGEKLLANLCSEIATKIAPHALIAFADSRQGVEHVADFIGRADILPYRGGYENGDRQAIEAMLHANELRGVIATSALELGIDIPQLQIGINLGLPQTRKALKQRIGRIGRTMPGAFAVIAPATAFAQLGGTFAEYVGAEVEPSRLYLDNRCIQIQAARCLLDECGNQGSAGKLPEAVQWPAGFAEMFAAARPGAIRPRDLDQVLAIGADSPHGAFPLRAMRETEFALRNIRNPSERMGKIDLEKALRETYPGATYYHLCRRYRVLEWRTSAYEHSIMLEPAKGLPATRALISSTVSVSTASGELIEDHLLEGERGQFAEILLKVADWVEGFACGSAVHWYRDLRAANWRMSRRPREFATTGIVLQIKEPWFTGKSQHALKMRQATAEALAAVLAREHNIARSDIRTAHSGIALYGAAGPRAVDDAIVIFDNVVGGLRLTSPLFSNFAAILDRLERASELAREEAMLSVATVNRLREWYESLGRAGDASIDVSPPADPPPGASAAGEIMIFGPGSIVGARIRGNFQERTLLAPRYAKVGDNDVLGYDYECREGARGWVPHDFLEPIGHDWHHALWNPSSNAIREVAA